MTASARLRVKRLRPARIVSVCIAGHPITQERFNTNRLELVSKVAREVYRRGWEDLDAILFPAGYVRLVGWLGPLSHGDRIARIEAGELSDVCRGAVHRLRVGSPDCLIAVGLDTNKSPDGWRGDQLVVAFDRGGVVGLARKIFPVVQDTDGWGRAPYLLFEADFDSPQRFVTLPNGERALLSACYDAFALAELVIGPTAKRRALRHLATPQGWTNLDRRQIDGLLLRFADRLRAEAPTVNLAALHGFRSPGRDLYWQRHGLATASAALRGGLTVGAAHFTCSLPSRLSSAPLAALGVPKAHLRASHNRTAHALAPVDGFETALAWSPGHRVLVRLYVGA